MITKLHLENFRGFEKHTVHLRQRTVAVGVNNAGKSTFVEALRLVGMAVQRANRANYERPPQWTGLSAKERVYTISRDKIGLDTATLFHGYREPPAIITATLEDDRRVRVFVGKNGALLGCILEPGGHTARSRVSTIAKDLPRISILPSIGPLDPEEEFKKDEYVRAHFDSRLASRHFRNQLRLLDDRVDRLRELCEGSWHGLQVKGLVREHGALANPLHLEIRDGEFVAEAAVMGHGLQMWLQVMWFLAKAEGSASIILDEPDVYLHPDLQRRLIRLLRALPGQVIVATHSVEILSEVNNEDVLVVERRKGRSGFVASSEMLQSVIDKIGGLHNVHLARLSRMRALILVEGDDMEILGRIHALVEPDSQAPLATFPNQGLGGWTNWRKAEGAASILGGETENSIRVYCILDRDFRTDEQLGAVRADMAAAGGELHVWTTKELENLLLNPAVFARIAAKHRVELTPDEIATQIDRICDGLRETVCDGIATRLQHDNKGWDLGTCNKMARERVSVAWAARESRWGLVPGKEVLSRLLEWLKATHRVSCSLTRILDEMRPAEVPQEVRDVVTAVAARRRLVGEAKAKA